MTTDIKTSAPRRPYRWMAAAVAALLAVGGAGYALLLPGEGDIERFYETEVSIDADARRSALLLHDFLDRLGYDLSEVGAGREVPRVFLAALPQDMGNVEDAATRKAVFLRTMLPLVLRANERIAADRARLVEIRKAMLTQQPVSEEDSEWLSDLAERYGTKSGNMAELLRRVDQVPPSLALAQAIEESGWGTSRFAQDGNSLFGHTTATGFGIRPKTEEWGAGRYDIRSFASLAHGVEAYIHNLNTHAAYAKLRRERAHLRSRKGMADGLSLAKTLDKYSERGMDYVNTLRSIIRGNNLTAFDAARLSQGPLPLPLERTILAQAE